MSKLADKTEEFHGRAAEMRVDNPWLAVEDIIDLGEVKVVIEGTYFHKGAALEDGRKEDKFALKFKGKTKQMILNATNRRALAVMFGTHVDKWSGKEVTLHVVSCRSPKGGQTKGIRIKVP